MAGHMGDRRVTVQNLTIVSTDVDRGLILVRGAVPGSEGSWVLVRDAVKHPVPKDAPVPGSVREVAVEEPVEEVPAEEIVEDAAPAEEAAPAKDAAPEESADAAPDADEGKDA